MATVVEIIKDLERNYKPEDQIACGIWTTDDVKTQAMNDDVELTAEQVDEVIDSVHKNIDAESGINWDVISQAIRDIGGC